MEDPSSTPIESVMDVEQEHANEANEALAELNGVSDSKPTQMYSDEMMHDVESDVPVPTEDDFWIQLCLTFVAVSATVFILFIPKVRQLIEPVIGTGYVALGIRSLVIGIISLLPRLLLM